MAPLEPLLRNRRLPGGLYVAPQAALVPVWAINDQCAILAHLSRVPPLAKNQFP